MPDSSRRNLREAEEACEKYVKRLEELWFRQQGRDTGDDGRFQKTILRLRTCIASTVKMARF